MKLGQKGEMLKVLLCFFIFFPSLATAKSICGDDSRVLAHNDRIGKIQTHANSSKVCTATLIGKNCALTAGHCTHLLKRVYFDTEVYEVDEQSIIASERDINRDWAVFNFRPHPLLKDYPGERRGFYQVEFSRPIIGAEISIAGFGEDRRWGGKHNYHLQMAYGSIHKLEDPLLGPMIIHDVDTMGGNSGSAIMTTDQRIIGIHILGDCGQNSMRKNMASLVYDDNELHKALSVCQGR
jgi:V8-like Glu-specific endopeptidase